jgi:hypothetical protein
MAVAFCERLPGPERRRYFNTFFHFFRDTETSGQAFELSTAPYGDGADEQQEEDEEGAGNLEFFDVSSFGRLGSKASAAAAAAKVGPVYQGLPLDDDDEEDADDDFERSPAFERIRADLYRDAAVFIACNETQPAFLLSMFQLLQRLDTDYLRLRSLNLLEDLLASVLPTGEAELRSQRTGAVSTPSVVATDEDPLMVVGDIGRSFDYEETADSVNSIVTPSELKTEDDDDDLSLAAGAAADPVGH